MQNPTPTNPKNCGKEAQEVDYKQQATVLVDLGNEILSRINRQETAGIQRVGSAGQLDWGP